MLLGAVVILIILFLIFGQDKNEALQNKSATVTSSVEQNVAPNQLEQLPNNESGAGYALNSNSESPTPKKYAIGDPRMFTNKFGPVSYITLSDLPLLKTTERTIEPAKAKVYLIGKLDGQWTTAGLEKFVALATYEFQSYSPKSNPEPFAKSYIYFISDEKGNPKAWDTKFVSGVGISPSGDLLGFSNVTPSDLSDIFPKGFGFERTEDFKAANISYGSTIFSAESLSGLTRLEGQTFHDLQVYRQKGAASASSFIADRYFGALPFGGKFVQLLPISGVNLDGHVIGSFEDGVFWTEGGIGTVDNWATAQQAYTTPFGEESKFLKLCPNIITKNQLEGALVQTGTTSFGNLLYEIDDKKFPKVYECLLANSWQDLDHKLTMSLSDFKKTHPMFFVKNAVGEWIEVARTNFREPLGHD